MKTLSELLIIVSLNRHILSYTDQTTRKFQLSKRTPITDWPRGNWLSQTFNQSLNPQLYATKAHRYFKTAFKPYNLRTVHQHPTWRPASRFVYDWLSKWAARGGSSVIINRSDRCTLQSQGKSRTAITTAKRAKCQRSITKT
jgi:hypothetical protein